MGIAYSDFWNWYCENWEVTVTSCIRPDKMLTTKVKFIFLESLWSQDSKSDLITNFIYFSVVSNLALILLKFKKTYFTYSVANCTRKIDTKKLKQFCTDANVYSVQAFPWASVTPSTHRAMSHLAEAIELNDSYGLGQISETCLESSNKNMRQENRHFLYYV